MRRPTKGIAFIVAGIILAIVIGFVANRMVSNAMEDTTVVVPKEDIEPFTQIMPDDVEEVERPASSISESTATSLNKVVGHFTTTKIVKGNPIQKEHIAVDGNNDLSSALTSFQDPDIRAFALPTENPMIKDISPGNQVDLYVDIEDDENSSVLIADNVLVLGIAEDGEDEVGLILALTQDQIEEITPVMTDIQISLVPYNVEGIEDLEGGDEK